jgi:hypothetical protein
VIASSLITAFSATRESKLRKSGLSCAAVEVSALLERLGSATLTNGSRIGTQQVPHKRRYKSPPRSL